jgi:hypothetical protein
MEYSPKMAKRLQKVWDRQRNALCNCVHEHAQRLYNEAAPMTKERALKILEKALTDGGWDDNFYSVSKTTNYRRNKIMRFEVTVYRTNGEPSSVLPTLCVHAASARKAVEALYGSITHWRSAGRRIAYGTTSLLHIGHAVAYAR